MEIEKSLPFEKREIDTFDELLESLDYVKDKNQLKKIMSAYTIAQKLHGNQVRKNGDPYIKHPLNVAKILADFHAPVDMIIAALLHDLVEDAEMKISDIETLFGKNVADIVQGVTRIPEEQGRKLTKEEADEEDLKILVNGIVENVGVAFVKIADRLHNMRTLDAMDLDKQIRKANQTLDYFAPLAHQLGLYSIRNELEDISLYYLDPKAYFEIEESVHRYKESVATKLAEVETHFVTDFDHLLKTGLIEKMPSIRFRERNIYGISKNLKTGKQIDEMNDLLGFEVIFNGHEDHYECANFMWYMSTKYEVVENGLKDYIGKPKTNSYQSYHMTFKTKAGLLFQIRARTKSMDKKAEIGLGADLSRSTEEIHSIFKENFNAYETFAEISTENENFAEQLYSLLHGFYVRTPGGRRIAMPKNGTIIDFAYLVHSEVARKIHKAKIYRSGIPIEVNEMNFMEYPLRNDDIIEIVKKDEGESAKPALEWFDGCKTKKAKTDFRRLYPSEYIAEKQGRRLSLHL